MTNFESFLLSYLANALWQVPLLFFAGWGAARVLRSLGAGAEHRVWVGVLLLQAALPACATVPAEWWRALAFWERTPIVDGTAHVSIVIGPGTAWGGLQIPAWLLGAAALAYALTATWFAVRFAWGLRKIHALRRNATEVALTGDAAQCWSRCSEMFGIANISFAASPQIFGPVTIGIVRKLILMPAGMVADLPNAEMTAAIAHEFAHIRRHDFLKNLIYEVLALPITFHPFFWFTHARLTESREMVCDQMAAQLGERHQYARSLLRLASLLVEGMPTRTPHAIGIFDATTFERRVMRLKEKQTMVSTRRRWLATAACALVGLAICASAVALSVHVDALAAGDEAHPASPGKTVKVPSDVMQGNLVSKVNPVYPAEAKKARIQGKVVLDAVIGKTGDVEELKVASGPRQLQQSALDAVRQWKYKPFLLNGEAVDVKSTVSVIYSLKK